jgi:hypothetical protein
MKGWWVSTAPCDGSQGRVGTIVAADAEPRSTIHSVILWNGTSYTAEQLQGLAALPVAGAEKPLFFLMVMSTCNLR